MSREPIAEETAIDWAAEDYETPSRGPWKLA